MRKWSEVVSSSSLQWQIWMVLSQWQWWKRRCSSGTCCIFGEKNLKEMMGLHATSYCFCSQQPGMTNAIAHIMRRDPLLWISCHTWKTRNQCNPLITVHHNNGLCIPHDKLKPCKVSLYTTVYKHSRQAFWLIQDHQWCAHYESMNHLLMLFAQGSQTLRIWGNAQETPCVSATSDRVHVVCRGKPVASFLALFSQLGDIFPMLCV